MDIGGEREREVFLRRSTKSVFSASAISTRTKTAAWRPLPVITVVVAAAPIHAAVIFHVFLRHFSPRNYPPAPKAVI